MGVASANVTAETLDSGRVGPAVEVAAANVTVDAIFLCSYAVFMPCIIAGCSVPHLLG